MKRRSPTPWKKSRTYGDIHGGRSRRRMTDNIFARTHSLLAPFAGQALPILVEDNPSRAFFFPVGIEDFAKALQRLPEDHHRGITHIWLRRSPVDPDAIGGPMAEFICGSGVRAIVIYPWRTDGRRSMGRKKPSPQAIAMFCRFGANLIRDQGRWYIHLNDEQLVRFYIEALLCHEVGHHVDWYQRHWSKANGRAAEEFADQYAFQWRGQVRGTTGESSQTLRPELP